MAQGGTDPDKPPQGWFADPFGVHESRWFSQGRPTALVRDGRAESQDPPPDGPVPGPLRPAQPAPRVGPAPVHASDDLLRASDERDSDGDVLDIPPGEQFDFFGNPALPGTMGMPAAAALGGPVAGGLGGGLVINPMDLGPKGPPTPRRVLRTRWIALAGTVVWSGVVTAQFLGSSTTVAGATPAHPVRETVWAADPGASLFLIALLVVACTVTGVGFVRRVRNDNDGWGRAGLVCACSIGILGILSLATIGLGLVLLAALLFVVARPIARPRPLPGERVPETPGPSV